MNNRAEKGSLASTQKLVTNDIRSALAHWMAIYRVIGLLDRMILFIRLLEFSDFNEENCIFNFIFGKDVLLCLVGGGKFKCVYL